ncbi:hypothetical protein [Streptomyces sp. NPDC056361]|uniref:hypothetical protein n=1 Tax=Streptomyces sp. NPDC056361 TaxID=3345795 RepID=UPI0035D7500D
MIKYWSAVVCRVAPAAGLVAVVVGGAMCAVLLLGDGAPWTSALAQSALAGLTCAVLFTLAVTTADTVTAVRTAVRYGLLLEPAAARLPSLRQVTADTPGATAFQLADSVLHAIKKAQAPMVSEVLELSHGRVSLMCTSPYGPEIHVSINITVADGRALAALTCRPVTSWKRLDGAASWTTAGILEPHVRAALKDH